MVRLNVCRLFCDDNKCERRLLAECLPDVAVPWARKTTRLAGRPTAVGLALGGAAGVRLGRKLRLNASRKTAVPDPMLARYLRCLRAAQGIVLARKPAN